MKKNIKEQLESGSQPTTNKEKLLKYVEVGCIPNGKLIENTGLSTYPEAIYTKTAKGNTLYFFHDGKIGLVGQDNKVKFISETIAHNQKQRKFHSTRNLFFCNFVVQHCKNHSFRPTFCYI